MIPFNSSLHLRHHSFNFLKNFIRMIASQTPSLNLKLQRNHSSHECLLPPSIHQSIYMTRSFSVHQRCYNKSDTKWEFFNAPQESTAGQSKKPARVIQDVIEAQWNPQPEPEPEPEAAAKAYNLERGKAGVFDLEELLDLLREQNGQDICVITIPKELDYTDHMVIVTARSPKHMLALGTFIRKRFKSKHLLQTDRIPRLEGKKDSEDWIALDLVNIFCTEAREKYDLETLWTVGPTFDDLTNKKDTEIIRLLQLFQ